MRRLIWLIVILGILWSAWWALAARGIERGLTEWQNTQRAQGWQADIGSLETTGYPLALNTQVLDVALADPTSGVAVTLDDMRVQAPAYWPGYLTLTLPQTPVQLRAPDAKIFFRAPGGEVKLRLHPGTALELEQLRGVSGPWQVNTPAGNLLSADSLHIEMAQDTSASQTYHMTVDAQALTPGDLWRETLALPSDWPLSFDAFTADMTLTLDRAIDRAALKINRPQPREITIQSAEVAWGPLRLTALGAVTIDPAGVPAGQLTLRAENWEQMLDLAETSGALPAALRPQTDTLLGMLANFGGDRDVLDLAMRFDQGQMLLGQIRLGPAPRIYIR